ncbi:MAG TPA: deoxyribonuclease IV [Candidatus Fimivicinus intestinavium]|nr:deoxyribonuclease IV [Candidatus Fimivicinus intestinavium]
MPPLFLGCHLSSSRGFLALGKTALRIGANTFQFFTRNPRGSRAKPLDEEDAHALRELMAEHGFGKLIAHAPYTLNACSADARVREFALETMADDLLRMESLPGNFYNFHPGSHVGQGTEQGIALIAEALNRILRPEQKTIVLLETMAGKGSEVGRRFEELREILDRVELRDHLGVCMDICHVFDAGYDIVNDLDGVLAVFDRVIGLQRLCALHLADSRNPLGSGKDRHAPIGEGQIGLPAFARIVRHPMLSGLPMCLETPCDEQGHAREIQLLRELAGEPSGRKMK